MSFRIFIISWAIFVIFSILLISGNIVLKKIVMPKHNTTAKNHVQQVPELTDILNFSNKSKQIKAITTLTERVGVEQALDILYKSPLPKTGEGHLLVHQIGLYAYKKYGADAILKCRDYFLYACYHGAIIEAATDQGISGITNMTDRCRGTYGRFFQCLHAAGHALLAMNNYEVPQALNLCDELYENETQYPNTLTSCHNGVFMENIFGVHDADTNKEHKRKWLSKDLYFPCNYFSEKYQQGCWMNQASWMLQLNHNDIAKTTKNCEEIGNKQYTDWCIDNLARQINPLTNGHPLTAFRLCLQMGTTRYDTCVIVNAIAYYSVSGHDEAISICHYIRSNVKKDCYNSLIGPIHGDSINQPEKERLCKKMEEPFNKQCLAQITTTQ